jgi:hypothetical protein
MFMSRRTVFMSYSDKISEDKTRAEKLAKRLGELRLKVILEDDKKKRKTDDFPASLYDQLTESDAVVSILSASSVNRPYIFFEALSARFQKKWFPVVFDDFQMPEPLSRSTRTSMKDVQLDDPKDPAISALAESIKKGTSTARYYFGTTRGERWRRLAVMLSVVATLVGFLSNLGNILTHVCSNTYFAEYCERLGWTQGLSTNR